MEITQLETKQMLSRMNRANGKTAMVMDMATTPTDMTAITVVSPLETVPCRSLGALTAMEIVGLMSTMISKTMPRNGVIWMEMDMAIK
jgi:hypothetical protein